MAYTSENLARFDNFYVTVNRSWTLEDSTGEQASVTLAPGRHELERVKAPALVDCDGSSGDDWFVLLGTSVGLNLSRWLDWQGVDYGDFEIEITPIEHTQINSMPEAAQTYRLQHQVTQTNYQLKARRAVKSTQASKVAEQAMNYLHGKYPTLEESTKKQS